MACVQVKIISFLYKNGKFLNYFKKHLIKICTKTHQIAPFFKIFPEELALEHLCHAQHAVSRHANIHFWKNYLHASVKPVMYAQLSLFGKKCDKKGPLFPIFKRSTSIHKTS